MGLSAVVCLYAQEGFPDFNLAIVHYVTTTFVLIKTSGGHELRELTGRRT
jgi:hypothetical protein